MNVKIYVFIMLLLLSTFANASEGYFGSSSENGITGIFDSPTARLLPNNHFRIGYFKADPYSNYVGAVSLFDRFELSGKIGEIAVTDWQNDEDYWSGYGNYKDKFVAFKYRFFKETKYRPALAVGINDPTGTKLFGAQYFVLSKQIYPFDFSIGMGLGRYGDTQFSSYGRKDILKNFFSPKEYIKNGNLFYSVQFRPSDRFSLLYEYSPIDYEKQIEDPAVKYNAIGKTSKHNFGLRYYVSPNFYLTASYQRGDTFGFGVTMPFEIGEPVIPIYTPPPSYSDKVASLPADAALKLSVLMNGFSPAGAVVEDRKAYIEISNNRFFFEEDGIEYAIRSIVQYDYKDIDEYIVIVKNKNVPLYYYTVSNDAVSLYKEEKLTYKELRQHIKVSRNYLDIPIENRSASVDFYYGYKPQFNFYLNDPSGFFKGSFGLRGWAGKYIYENLSLIGGLALYPLNTVSTVNEPLSRPVRSDMSEYIDKKYILENLELDYITRIPRTKLYFNAELGILETQYAGLNADIGTHFFKDRLLVALSGHVVKKRDKENEFMISKDSETYKTYFLKTRLVSHKLKGYLEVHAGQFLAGDKGAKFILTKNINGVLLTTWYTKTDTAVFTDRFNRGYSDTGIMVTVPFRLFSGKDSKTTFSQSISPWTRDVGAQVGEFTNIMNFIGKTPNELH